MSKAVAGLAVEEALSMNASPGAPARRWHDRAPLA
jgi:hypothetical protein